MEQGPQTNELYNDLNDAALIDAFYDTNGDAAIGQELAVRLFAHAGFEDDPRTTPLVGRDGQQIQGSKGPLMLSDYINFAAEHHFEAMESMWDFFDMEPGNADYETMRSSMIARLKPGHQG